MAEREESLTIRFTEDEMADIQRLADEEDRKRGPMVRRLVQEAIAARAGNGRRTNAARRTP